MIAIPTALEPVTILTGDCLEMMKLLPDGCVQAVITDPPYSSRTHRDHDASASGYLGISKDGANRKALGYEAWSEDDVQHYVPELCRVCSGWVVIMTDHVLCPAVHRALDSCGRYVFAPLPFYSPGSRCRLSGDGPSSWTIWIVVARTKSQSRWGTLPGGYLPGTESGWREKHHMGGKPVRLLRELIRDYSKPHEMILDPFCGSGTTGVAAVTENRRCLMMECNPEYVQVSRRRVAEALNLSVRRLPVGSLPPPGMSLVQDTGKTCSL